MRAPGPLLDRLRRVPPLVADGAIAAGIFALGGLGQLATPDSGPDPCYVLPHSQRPAALGLLALAALGVTLRRKHLRVAVVLVVLAAVGGLFAWGDQYGLNLPEVALLYTVSERASLAASLVAVVATLLLPFLAGYHRCGSLGLSDLPLAVALYLPQLLMIWFAGRAQRRRRAVASELERGVALLNEERERLARTAVAAERSHIARDLHTLAVRGVERMILQTGAARNLVDSDPSRASQAIAAIESIGRGTLVEMRRLLVVLRAGDDARVQADRDAFQFHGEGARPGVLNQHSARRSPSVSVRPSLGQGASQLVTRWTLITRHIDALVVFVLTVAIAEPILVPWPIDMRIFGPLVGFAVGVLLVRRRFPLVVLGLVALDVFVYNAFLRGTPGTVDLSMMVAVYTVAVLRGRWWSVVAMIAMVVGYAPLLFVRPQILWPYDLAGFSALFLFAMIGGLAVRSARRLHAELQDQTEVLRRTREERIRLAVDEERTRIAREVHDLVAHGMTLMVIQAGAARWLVESDPPKADEALRSVARAGAEALRELRSLVGSLDDSRRVTLEPVPMGDQLTIRSLVGHEIEAGMNVELVIAGEPRELAAGLELSLYRIVQEALTNVRKHAAGAKAWVEFRYTSVGVEVEVIDTGGVSLNGQRQTVPGAGQGLVGIAERAVLFGGRAEAGPTPEGGFRVRASLAEERVLV